VKLFTVFVKTQLATQPALVKYAVFSASTNTLHSAFAVAGVVPAVILSCMQVSVTAVSQAVVQSGAGPLYEVTLLVNVH
jgi:hypothetical protein